MRTKKKSEQSRINPELIVRGIAVRDGKVLVCQAKGFSHWFFPGGHIEMNESASQALKREFAEELGIVAQGGKFMGAVENFYAHGKVRHHEVSLVFRVGVKNVKIESKEDHLKFRWIPVTALRRTEVLPRAMKLAVRRWLGNKQSFWVTQK
ncbi:NUDIX domain-containing protein [Patescibacteria group bacterium]|nr:MAG: NUDIX domain-containing protein [Patescibacteria group bacterium]